MSKLRNIIGWVVILPVAAIMAFAAAPPLVRIAPGFAFMTGVALGAWIW